MTDETRKKKNENIAASRKETSLKRESQVCRVYQLKIDGSRLSKAQKEQLEMLFVEAKWFYNDILRYAETDPIKEYNASAKKVLVLKQGAYEEREIRYLGSQMKQSIKDSILTAIRVLATLKKNGHKVGKLKYKASFDCINLKQLGANSREGFVRGKNRVKIPAMKKLVVVRGLDQLTPDMEIANAKIIKRASGFYIKVTTYSNKKEETLLPEIGIDFGIKTHITTSEGKKYKAVVEESGHLKHRQRIVARRKKGSNNYVKAIKSLRREYERLSNKKNDLANKIVHELLQYEMVDMQDENLKGWHSGLFGKQVQHSVLGRIKAKLAESGRVTILARWLPTSKLCVCGHKKKELTLKDRIYHCDVCGYEEDRDVHAAKNMVRFAKALRSENCLPTERRAFDIIEKLVEEGEADRGNYSQVDLLLKQEGSTL